MNQIGDTLAREAADYLANADPVLRPIIDKYGLCPIRPNTNYYSELIDAIISQQLSVHAARAIELRFRQLFNGNFPRPEQILAVDIDTLRSLGLSRAKATYICDLAQHILDGHIQFAHLDALSNSEIISELTAVKGIGTWTAHMFLIFCMGRPDVLPTGDLGIRNGVRKLYAMTDLPTPQQVSKLAEDNKWHPYESIASWYIWRELDGTPAV